MANNDWNQILLQDPLTQLIIIMTITSAWHLFFRLITSFFKFNYFKYDLFISYSFAKQLKNNVYVWLWLGLIFIAVFWGIKYINDNFLVHQSFLIKALIISFILSRKSSIVFYNFLIKKIKENDRIEKNDNDMFIKEDLFHNRDRVFNIYGIILIDEIIILVGSLLCYLIGDFPALILYKVAIFLTYDFNKSIGIYSMRTRLYHILTYIPHYIVAYILILILITPTVLNEFNWFYKDHENYIKKNKKTFSNGELTLAHILTSELFSAKIVVNYKSFFCIGNANSNSITLKNCRLLNWLWYFPFFSLFGLLITLFKL